MQLDMVTLYLKLQIEISWRELVYITAMKAVMQMGTSSFEKKKEILTCEQIRHRTDFLILMR